MGVLDIIERKRDGQALEFEDWNLLAEGIKQRQVPGYQLAALNGAVAIRGLDKAEREGLKGALATRSLEPERLEVPDIGVKRPLYGGTIQASSRPYHGLLARKLEGGDLSEEEIDYFVRGVAENLVSDEEIAAFCMAVYIRGMTEAEVVALTRSMVHSGDVLEWPGLPGPMVDKHSTGGVGDKVSLPLTGILAACGVYVPMISGRGLGHTGGTLDKLQAIPGYRIDLSTAEIRSTLEKVHAVITGQTSRLAPADKRMYAIRDVSATVSSIPLITASILSKKLAEGLDALVLDVKVGSGAFMETFDAAVVLAESLGRVGRAAGVRVSALLTPMYQPLGQAVGNANEVAESVACLRGKGPGDLYSLVTELGTELLHISGHASSPSAARLAVSDAISSGRALAGFRAMVEAQGGDPKYIDDPELLPRAGIRHRVVAPIGGFIQQLDARKLGRALVSLGGGRRVQEDEVDPAVGLWIHHKVGARVASGEAIVDLYANDPERLPEAQELVTSALRIGPTEPEPIPLILNRK